MSKSEQSQLTLSRQSPVDFETNCACHQKTISIGHVCSVCLSIFCNFIPVCSMCRYVIVFYDGRWIYGPVGRNLNLNGEQHIHGGLSITAAFN